MASNPISPDYVSDNEPTASCESDTSYHTSKFKCDECNHKFTTRFNLNRHMKSFHEESSEESDEESSEETDMSVDENDSNTESSDEDTSDASDDERSSEEDSNDDEENYPTSMFKQLLRQTVDKHEDELCAFTRARPVLIS